MAKMLNCNLEVSESESLLCNYIPFRAYTLAKSINLHIPSSLG